MLADGPLDEDKRRCTDCLWVPIFFLFALFGLIIAIWSIPNQNIVKLLAPIDAAGYFCGLDGDDGAGKDYPKLYFPDVSSKT